MNTREQPAPGVTAQDIERWLDADRDRLRRLEARRLPDAPDTCEALGLKHKSNQPPTIDIEDTASKRL